MSDPKNRTNTPADDVDATYPGYIVPAFAFSGLSGRFEFCTASKIESLRLNTTRFDFLSIITKGPAKISPAFKVDAMFKAVTGLSDKCANAITP